MSGRVWAEQTRAGSGYDIQDEAFKRLGPELREEFDALTTSGKIRQFAETHKDVLKPEEYDEFNGYADYIGLLFGPQDEVGQEKPAPQS